MPHQFSLRYGLRETLQLARILGIAYIACAIIVGGVHWMRPEISSRFLFVASIFPAGLFLVFITVVGLPLLAADRASRAWARRFPTFVEITRAGIRTPAGFFPHSRVETLEVVEGAAGPWLSVKSRVTWLPSGFAIAPAVDLAALRTMLRERDMRSTATSPPTTTYPAQTLSQMPPKELATSIVAIMGGVAYAIGTVLAWSALFTRLAAWAQLP